MLSEGCKQKYNKCEHIKERFLNDENFNKKRNMVNRINKSMHELLLLFCSYNEDNEIIVDCRYLKLLTNINGVNFDFIIEHFMHIMKEVAKHRQQFVLHLGLHSFGLTDLEKHYPFITKLSDVIKANFPDNLEKCFIYKAPYIVSQFVSILSHFIDKKTMPNFVIIE